MRLPRTMAIAVQLDDQHRIAAGEIGDIGADDLLAAELDTLKPPGAQREPEARFRRRLGEGKGATFCPINTDIDLGYVC